MKLLDVVDYDVVNYKKPSMFLIFPNCSLKCDRECGKEVCQNNKLLKMPKIDISADDISVKYKSFRLTKSIVCGGMEPFDSEDDLKSLLVSIRYQHFIDDDIVIYTGYTEDEVHEMFPWVFRFKNIIIKFGRFIPDTPSRYDEILGVTLASSNQYAKEFNKSV